MPQPRVTVLHDGVLPPGMASIEALAEVRTATADDLRPLLADTDVLLAWDFLTPALDGIDVDSTALRWIHTASAGVDNVLTPGVAASTVTVTNSRGVFDQAIAEYVLGVVLMYAKDLHGTWSRQRDRQWEHRETESLHGRRVVVVGVGPIGRAIARLLTAVGMQVAGVGRTARSGDVDFGEIAASTGLVERVGSADFVVLAAPLTEQTRGLVDRDVLAAMAPTARLVNVGRGELVVEPDLVAALADGVIAGAALDVFEREPLPVDSPLWGHPSVLVSPHMSADVVGWRDELAALFTDNLHRWSTGQPLRNVVDKTLGYVRTPDEQREPT